MKFVSNAGSDRVLDLIRPWLKPEHRMDMVSPSFSLYAFSEVLTELPHLSNARLVVPPILYEILLKLGLLNTERTSSP